MLFASFHMPENMQYIYYACGVLSIIFTVIQSNKQSEQRFEKRITRTETLLMMCCKKLNVPMDDINR